jgi:hypothetical protein
VGETDYRDWLDLDTAIGVRFRTRRSEVTDYVVVLLAVDRGALWAVRVYDNTHERHDMHRYNREGVKRAAETFHRGSGARPCWARSRRCAAAIGR